MTKQTEALKLALEANIALRHWIQAIPADTVLPAMPGIDGDWLDGVDAAIREALAEQPAQREAAPQQELVLASGLTEAETNATASVMGLTKKAQQEPVSDSWYAAKEIDEMVRDLDVAMNCENAATQAKLCDLMPTLIKRLTEQPAQPQQEPVAWLEILRNNKTATDEVIGAFLRGHAEHLTRETFVLSTPAAPQPAQRKPLTDEFLRKLHHEDQFGLFCDYDEFEQIARAIEAAHGIKENT